MGPASKLLKEGDATTMTPVQRAFRGGRNDWRLHALSVFSVSVAFICLASALLVVFNVDGVRRSWARAGRASVYLTANASEKDIAEIEAALRKTAGVRDVRFVSSDVARKEILGTTNDSVLGKLPGEAFPASLEVALSDDAEASRLKSLAGSLGALPAVESVETYEAWTERLESLLMGGVTAAGLLSAVVLAAVVSVVASTIRLTLQRRRIEVEVLKLVGASDGYVRRPFVIEGAAQGALGALLGTLFLGGLYLVVKSQFDTELSLLVGASPMFLPWYAILAMMLCGAAMGGLAAHASLKRLLLV